MKKSNIRKTAAIGLAFIGLAGVGVASAATLNVTDADDDDLVQAGVEDVSADLCQEDAILVSFATTGQTPGNAVPGDPFGYDAGDDEIVLTQVDVDCLGKVIEVALGDTADAVIGETAPHTLVTGDEVSLSFSLASDFGSVVDVEDISQVSVTIYDA